MCFNEEERIYFSRIISCNSNTSYNSFNNSTIVLKTISNSEVQSEKQSIDGYARVIEDDKSNFEMTHPGQQYQIKPDEDYDYKGNRVFCQERYFDSNNHDKLVLKNCYVSETKLSNEEESKKNHYNYINGKVELIKNNNNSTNNNENTNNNKTYEIGEEVTVKNEKYNVIRQGDDYVTLLKQEPLTVSTLQQIGLTADYNWQDYGSNNDWAGVMYDEDSNYYNDSKIKNYVETWAANVFKNNELRSVDDYKVRLVKFEELLQFYPNCSNDKGQCDSEAVTPNWLYKDEYYYWTMTEGTYYTQVRIVMGNGRLG